MLMVNNFTGFGAASSTGGGPAPSGDDEWWDQVVLSIHGNGDVVDVKGHTLSLGATTASVASPKQWGSGSLYFDGTTGAAFRTASGENDFCFATGDFTIEFWVYFNSVAGTFALYDGRVAAYNSAYPLLYVSGAKLRYRVLTDTGTDRIVGTTTLTTGVWYYIALDRSSGTTRIYVNATEDGTPYADSTNYLSYTAGNGPAIGGNRLGAEGITALNGYLDDIRITKGIGRWGGIVEVPAAENQDAGQEVDANWSSVVLAMHMNGLNNGTVFHDEKGKTVTKTGGVITTVTEYAPITGSWASAQFDGGVSYLETPYSADFRFGTGNFTVEFWFKLATLSAVFRNLVSFGGSTASDRAWLIYMSSGAYINMAVSTNGTSNTHLASGDYTKDTTWHHFAAVRNGSTLTVYIDGVAGLYPVDISSSSIFASSSTLRVGIDHNNVNQFEGQIDDLRITKGVARYTANFDVPTRMFPRS